MLKMKTLGTLMVLFLLVISSISAGDTATFVDLGFSPDGRIYAFAQYGVQKGTLLSWADLYIVDVPRNNFVNGGRLTYVHDSPVVFGQDGSGAFHHILRRNAALVDQHQVNNSAQGRLLYLSLDNNPTQTIEFRDFENGSSYRATLVSTIEGSGADLRSSFHISLERTARDGTRRVYTVGTPQLRRPHVTSYRIRQVMMTPLSEDSMILVIEMRLQDGSSFDIRYMVEAVRL